MIHWGETMDMACDGNFRANVTHSTMMDDQVVSCVHGKHATMHVHFGPHISHSLRASSNPDK